MAFHFPLESVLHYRQSLEHQQELRLRAANQQVARARHFVEQLDARLQQLKIRQSQESSAGTSGAELRFSNLCEATLRQQHQALMGELKRLQNLRDEQQKIFQQARRERETFEILRDQQLHEYKRESARREQWQLDDLFLMRQAYLRRG
jgi:flagellar export protein FliJ